MKFLIFSQKDAKSLLSLVVLLTLFFLIVFSGVSSYASSAATALYNEANRLYRDGEYLEAAKQYEAILKTGIQNGDVYYNLGNAYFKSGRIGRAILWYERALRLRPRDEDVKRNLRFANLRKVDKDLPSDANIVTRFILGVHNLLTVDEQTILCSALFYSITAAIVALLFAGTTVRTALITLLICFGVLWLVAGVSTAAKIYRSESEEEAVVISPDADAFSGPGEDNTKIFTLHEGTKVTIERRSLEWFLVRLSDNTEGWIQKEVVEKI